MKNTFIAALITVLGSLAMATEPAAYCLKQVSNTDLVREITYRLLGKTDPTAHTVIPSFMCSFPNLVVNLTDVEAGTEVRNSIYIGDASTCQSYERLLSIKLGNHNLAHPVIFAACSYPNLVRYMISPKPEVKKLQDVYIDGSEACNAKAKEINDAL